MDEIKSNMKLRIPIIVLFAVAFTSMGIGISKNKDIKKIEDEAARIKAIEDSKPSCKNTWKLCKDNADLVQNYNGMISAEAACQISLKQLSKYGSPKYHSWAPRYRSYRKGDSYLKNGILFLGEKQVSVPNAFGTLTKGTAYCTYSLEKKSVLDISFDPQ